MASSQRVRPSDASTLAGWQQAPYQWVVSQSLGLNYSESQLIQWVTAEPLQNRRPMGICRKPHGIVPSYKRHIPRNRY